MGAHDNFGQFYCQQILPFIQLKMSLIVTGPLQRWEIPLSAALHLLLVF